jgi:uncharacterized protein (TIGR03086 family)
VTEDSHASLDLLDRAVAQTSEIVAALEAKEASLPTPCHSWNVGHLVSHVVHGFGKFAEMAKGGDWRAGDPAPMDPRDWGRASAGGADALMAAWRSRDELTDRDLQRINQQTAEFVVHGWDLARATHRSMVIDADIAEAALAWAQRNLKPEFRGDEESGKVFGPEMRVAEDAPAGDRLAGFFGRDVAAWPA